MANLLYVAVSVIHGLAQCSVVFVGGNMKLMSVWMRRCSSEQMWGYSEHVHS
jgi:hypothetical protein